MNFCFLIGCLKVKGGAAEAGGRLISGDQILSINDSDVSDANQEQVAEMLKVSLSSLPLLLFCIFIFIYFPKE